MPRSWTRKKTVDAAALVAAGVMPSRQGRRSRLLADGEMKVKVKFDVHPAHQSRPREKIEKAGG
jgi:ribosomal protein L15